MTLCAKTTLKSSIITLTETRPNKQAKPFSTSTSSCRSLPHPNGKQLSISHAMMRPSNNLLKFCKGWQKNTFISQLIRYTIILVGGLRSQRERRSLIYRPNSSIFSSTTKLSISMATYNLFNAEKNEMLAKSVQNEPKAIFMFETARRNWIIWPNNRLSKILVSIKLVSRQRESCDSCGLEVQSKEAELCGLKWCSQDLALAYSASIATHKYSI